MTRSCWFTHVCFAISRCALKVIEMLASYAACHLQTILWLDSWFSNCVHTAVAFVAEPRNMSMSAQSGWARVTPAELHAFASRCLVSVGMQTQSAEDLADLIVAADHRGHYSHGLNRLGELGVQRNVNATSVLRGCSFAAGAAALVLACWNASMCAKLYKLFLFLQRHVRG